MSDAHARRAAELAARESYGRLVALLASRSRDIAAAEDALSEAFAAALSVWPKSGVPDRPEAWLLVAARRVQGHAARALRGRDAAQPTVAMLADELAQATPDSIPDERLKLLFVCAHPALDPGVRTALMLQTVLGLDAARIATAFLLPPATMGQRLVRAKAKIKDAGMPFLVPDLADGSARLRDVLAAIYAAFGTGWDRPDDGADAALVEEAIYLARLLVALLPAAPEAKGLLALMLYCDARKAARRSASGAFVPLSRQDPLLWSRDRIVEAEALLVAASKAGQFGRYMCEAAIQSVHVQRAITGTTHHAAIARLYDLLAAHEPTLGVLVARAAAVGEAQGAQRGLDLLDELPSAQIETYQPYWATKAHLLKRLGRQEAAYVCTVKAVGLTADPAIREYLADA